MVSTTILAFDNVHTEKSWWISLNFWGGGCGFNISAYGGSMGFQGSRMSGLSVYHCTQQGFKLLLWQ